MLNAGEHPAEDASQSSSEDRLGQLRVLPYRRISVQPIAKLRDGLQADEQFFIKLTLRHDPTLLPLPAEAGFQQAEAEVPLSFGEQLVPWRILAGHPSVGISSPLGFVKGKG